MLIMKYLEDIEERFTKERYKDIVFRGQKCEQWKIMSSAARRLKNNRTPNQSDFIKYHRVLLEEARNGNYTELVAKNTDVSKLNDLELLANIQHFGGATCLTDFTYNFLVSLWFATTSYKIIKKGKEIESDGAVFAINLKSRENKYEFVNVETFCKNKKTENQDNLYDISKLLTYDYENIMKDGIKPFWYWKPINLNNRIHQQNSIFIFGISPLLNSDYHKITIKGCDKQIIRSELRTYFNIDTNRIFPDFHGFSSELNNVNANYTYFENRDCYEIAESYLEENSFNDCNRYLDKVIHCNGYKKCNCERGRSTEHVCPLETKADAYYMKGLCAYRRLLYELSYDFSEIINKQEYIRQFTEDCVKNLKEALNKRSHYSEESLHYLLYAIYEIGNLIDSIDEKKSFYLKQIKDLDIVLLKHFEYFDIKNNNRIRIIFSILEFSLFASNEREFNHHIQKLFYLIQSDFINQELLYKYFQTIGRFLFLNRMDEKDLNVHELFESPVMDRFKIFDKKIQRRDKKKIKSDTASRPQISDFLDPYIYWNFGDMIDWLTLLKDNLEDSYPNLSDSEKAVKIVDINKLLSFSLSLDKAHKKWQEMAFDRSLSFDDSAIQI